jgi:type IV pilus assembly protein PilW
MKPIKNNHKGMSLIELLVAMAVGTIVLGVIYSAYQNQQKSYVTQQLVVDMLQNARAAMSLMKREIRMAGYDPAATDGIDNENPDDGLIDAADLPDESAGSGILIAGEDQIQFTADLSYSTATADDTLPDLLGPDENLTYTLVGTELQRSGQILAYDIEAIGFAYAFDDDGDGVLDQSAGGNIIWAVDSNLGDNELDTFLDTNDDGVIDINDAEGGAALAGQVPIGNIRAVRIWLLARTRQPIRGYTDNRTYPVGIIHRGPGDAGWDASRRHVVLTATVYCRNIGT